MANVSEKSLQTSTMPSVYVRKIVLEDGPSIAVKKSNAVDTSRRVRKKKTKDGKIQYEPSPMTKAVFTEQDGSLRSRVEVVIKEVVPAGPGRNNEGSWIYNRDEASLIKLKVIQSTNAQLSKYLVSSNFFNKCMVKIPPQFIEFVDYQQKEITLSPEGASRGKLSESWNDSTGNRIVGVYRTFTFDAPEIRPKHLTYFATCEFHSDQTNPQTEAVHSPVTIERVVNKSQPVENAAVYRTQEGQIWAGPVHYHPSQGWMEGAFHTSQTHGKLTREGVPNLKVHDLRILDDVAKLPITLVPQAGFESQKTDYFSDLYLTRDKNGRGLMVFNFDHINYIIDRSKFGALVETAAPGVRESIISRSPIMNLEVYRRRVVLRNGLNRLQSAAEVKYEFNPIDAEPEEIVISSADAGSRLKGVSKYNATGEYANRFVLLPSNTDPPSGYELTGDIKEIPTGARRLRSFSIGDIGISHITDGEYQYGVRLKVKDGTLQFLQTAINDFAKAISLVEKYARDSERPINYQKTLGRFTQRFWRQNSDQGGRIVEPWMGAIVKYIEVLDLATDITSVQKNLLSKALYSMISPYTGSPEGIFKFIGMMRTLESQIFQVAKISKKPHARDRSSLRQTKLSSGMDAEHLFNEVFDSNVLKGTGFDYFGVDSESSGIREITADSLRSRIDTELQRYAPTSMNADQVASMNPSLSSDQVTALVEDSDKYSHMAPAFLEMSNNRINLLSPNIDPLDYVAATAVVGNAIKNPAARSVSVPPSGKAVQALTTANQGASAERLGVLNALSVENIINLGIEIGTVEELDDDIASFSEPSSDYLWGDSPFATEVGAEPNLRIPVPTQEQDILSVASRLMTSELSVSPDAKVVPFSFDLSANNNFIDRRLRPNVQLATVEAQDAVTKAIAALPRQVRLLATAAEPLYGEANDANSNGFIYNFSMLRKIEYLSNYDDESLKRPHWRQLADNVLDNIEAPLLCRIKRYENSVTNVGEYNEVDQLPVYDEYFFITPRSQFSASRRGSILASGARVVVRPSIGTKSGFIRSSLTGGPSQEIVDQLFTYETAQVNLGLQTDYAMTRVPKAPANRFGSVSGVSTSTISVPSQPVVSPAAQSAPASTTRTMTSTAPAMTSAAPTPSTSGGSY
jgi:hypothetical protein